MLMLEYLNDTVFIQNLLNVIIGVTVFQNVIHYLPCCVIALLIYLINNMNLHIKTSCAGNSSYSFNESVMQSLTFRFNRIHSLGFWRNYWSASFSFNRVESIWSEYYSIFLDG